MKRIITAIALLSTLVFAVTTWSEESPMKHGKMGMGESSQMKTCMKMMGEMETMNAALDELVGRMQATDGAKKVTAMEEVLTMLVAQRRELHKRRRGMQQMKCGGTMQ